MRLAILGVRMTNSTRLFAAALTLGISALAAPAFAQHASQGGYAPMVGATDPCVLGTNVQPGACVGPVRVAPMIMSQGPVQLQPAYAPQPTYAPQPNYVAEPIAYAQPIMQAPTQAAPVQMSGCVPGYGGPTVPCNGNWVYTNQAAPQPMMQPAPQYVPAPQYAPAPQYLPAPIAYAPQPQQVGAIPTSFFTGGITYGAGFPTDTSYVSGGGGYGYSSGGGPRFSGVRERSPTPLIAPPMRQRHAPPPAHHHGCGC
jgi:hypothetical protein